MKILQSCFTLLFLLFLSIPFTLTICDCAPEPIDNQENRVLAWPPKLKQNSLRNWPKRLDPWFKDYLAFRTHFLCLYHWIWGGFLGSNLQDYAITFKGELFPTLNGATVLQNYLGLYPYTKEQITNFKLLHAGIYARFKSEGIPYIIVPVPDKTNVYPEYLPFWASWAKGLSYYDELIQAIQEIHIPYIDMLPILESRKSEHQLYNKRFDTAHWNGWALEVAYQAMGNFLTNIDKGFEPRPSGEIYEIYFGRPYPRLYTRERVPLMNVYSHNLHVEHLPELSKENPCWADPQLIINDKAKLPYTLWFVSDSYFLFAFDNYQPWIGGISPLAHHTKKFLRMHFNTFTQPFIEKSFGTSYAPDIVIRTFVERLPRDLMEDIDPVLKIYGDIHLGTPGYILTPNNLHKVVAESNCCITREIDQEEQGIIIIDSSSNIPLFTLAPVIAGKDGRVMFATYLKSPIKTTARLYYTPKSIGTLNKEDFVSIELEEGENIIYMSFDTEPEQEMVLYFEPGCHPGTYKVLPMPKGIQHVQHTYSRES